LEQILVATSCPASVGGGFVDKYPPLLITAGLFEGNHDPLRPVFVKTPINIGFEAVDKSAF
jgi:hypothetical protein